VELEPGLIVREPMPFAPRVSYDGLFASLLDDTAPLLGSADDALAPATTAVSGDGAPDVGGAYDTIIGGARDAHQANVDRGTGSVADALTGTGEQVTQLRASVIGYLPPPETAPDTSFVEPPPPDYSGGGQFDQGGQDTRTPRQFAPPPSSSAPPPSGPSGGAPSPPPQAPPPQPPPSGGGEPPAPPDQSGGGAPPPPDQSGGGAPGGGGDSGGGGDNTPPADTGNPQQ